MSEPRNHQIVVNIEETFFDLTHLLASKNNVTASKYVRDIIIKDLLEKGMLSERTLTQIILN